MIRLLCRILTFIVLALISSRAYADIAPNPITAGWPISPYDSVATDVRMVAEVVAVRIYPDSVVTVAVFSMRNDGKTTTMAVGFPFGNENDVLAFRAFVGGVRQHVRNGSKQHSTTEHLKDSSTLKQWTVYWKMWDMTFRAGEGCEVRVEYKTKPYEIGGYYFRSATHPGLTADVMDTLNKAMVSRHAEYTLDTGRAWKGTLDACKVSFELVGLSADHIGRYQPPDGVVADNRITWTYANYEPRGFVNLEYLPVLTKEQRKDVFLQASGQFPDDARLAYDAGRYCDSYTKDSTAEYDLYYSFLTRWDKPIPQLIEYASGGRCRVNLRQERGFFLMLSMAKMMFQQYEKTGQLEKCRPLAPKLSKLSQAVVDSLATCSSAEQSTPWLIQDAITVRDLCKPLIKTKQ